MHEWMHSHAPPVAVRKAFDTFEESLKLLDRDSGVARLSVMVGHIIIASSQFQPVVWVYLSKISCIPSVWLNIIIHII